MHSLKEIILSCLKDLKGSGKFISVGTTEFLFPGLKVDGVGEIAYPVNATQAKSLIQVAQKAPFGKGSETIVDKSVRNGWEIDPEKLTFNGSRWAGFLDKVIREIKPDLGLEDYTISAHLYKMLIYEKGGFFLPHKDSEKEKGMFGTLVIGLPSRHTGGELVVSFEGVEEAASFAESSADYKINYAAFYADCDHEIKPVTSGYRVCLVYNLIQQKSGKQIQATSMETHTENLAEILKRQQDGIRRPLIVLLEHQYTPKNFSTDALKLNDRPKAELLMQAAQKAGYYAKMCLVTSYLSGMPDDDYYGYDDEDYEDAEMVEVYEDELSIGDWLENGIPPLRKVLFQEQELIASFALDDDEPIVKEANGYMGNYGPDLMHWYHYGAVMIWPPEVNAQLLPEQNVTNQLEWIGYFNKNIHKVSESEISIIEHILSRGLDNAEHYERPDYTPIADWLIHRKNDAFFLELDPQLMQFYFIKIDAAHWVKLTSFFPTPAIEKIFALVMQDISLPVIGQLLSVLRALSTTGEFNHLVTPQIKKLPDYFSEFAIEPAKKEFQATTAALGDLFWIEKKSPQGQAWVKRMAEMLTEYPDRNYINQVLVPQLLALNESTELTSNVLLTCRQYLQEWVNNKPQPPADWSRKVPLSSRFKNQWSLLKPFLESPDERVFDYRINQSERNEMEKAIRNSVIDLKMDTIRIGSPHTLRITKTQAAYNREMKKWKEDRELLNKVIQKIEG